MNSDLAVVVSLMVLPTKCGRCDHKLVALNMTFANFWCRIFQILRSKVIRVVKRLNRYTYMCSSPRPHTTDSSAHRCRAFVVVVVLLVAVHWNGIQLNAPYSRAGVTQCNYNAIHESTIPWMTMLLRIATCRNSPHTA